MEKNYLRYVSAWHAGVIASPRCNVVWDSATEEVVCGSVRDVVTWKVRAGEQARKLCSGDEEGNGFASSPLDGVRGEVVCVASGAGGCVAAAYGAGLVRVWRSAEDCAFPPLAFEGHAAAVGAMRWCPESATVVTGGANGDVVLFDVVAERGACRLRGHKAGVTDVCCVGDWTAASGKFVVSTSRDGLVKVWDVGLKHCCQTLTGAGGGYAVGADYDPVSQRLATGAGDRALRLWTVDADRDAPLSTKGSLTRQAMEPTQELRFAAPRVLCCLSHGRSLEVYAARDEDAALKKAKRRVKRKREKGTLGADCEDDSEELGAVVAVTAQDEFELVAVLTSEHRLRSFCCAGFSGSTLRLVCATRTNALESYECRVVVGADAGGKRKRDAGVPKDPSEALAVGPKRSVEVPGHRSAVRALAMSTDGDAVASASQHAVKVWAADASAASSRLYRTVATPKLALSLCFLPGSTHLAVGLKSGGLYVYDVATGEGVEARDDADGPAHAGAIFAVDASTSALQGKVSLVTAGADADAKLWDWAGGRLSHAKTLSLGEEALCAKFVRDARGKRDGFVCVATMDNCVRVVYADTFKFKVSLYGHQLNCLCLDGSSDGKLLATGGADKTVKLWGLEFGDLRHSVLAHDDAVTALVFLRGTHYAFTCSKDGTIKQWDCDHQDAPFVQQFKRGHASEVWALAPALDGAALYSAGADRSIRCWARTDEPVFASEEQDAALDLKLDAMGRDAGLPETTATDARTEAQTDHVVPARASATAQRGAERIAEALELAQGEAGVAAANRAKNLPPPKPSPLLLGLDPQAYVLKALAQVTTADLEPALLVLPIDLVAVLLTFLADALDSDDPLDVELCARSALFAIQMHHKAVAAHEPLKRPLLKLKTALRARIDAETALYGRNLAAVRIAGLRLTDHVENAAL